MTKYQLFIGLNDKDTKKQEIETSAAFDLVSGIMFQTTGGATITTGAGVYTHENGQKIIEKTIITTINDYDDSQAENVKKAAAAIKKALNQESILLTAQALTACDLI